MCAGYATGEDSADAERGGCALSYAELVDLVVRQSAVLAELQALASQQRQSETELLQVCTPSLHADKAQVPQAVLCRRIPKGSKGAVPRLWPIHRCLSTNNAP